MMDCEDGQRETCVASDLQQRPACDPFTGVAIRIGVMRSAGNGRDLAVVDVCRRSGNAIAQAGCTLLTGACGGLPHAAALGAQEVGGQIVGISPAGSLREHVEIFRSPFNQYGTLIFTGLGFLGRELVNIRSSDIVIVIGGRSGTLGEFAIAYDEGKLMACFPAQGVSRPHCQDSSRRSQNKPGQKSFIPTIRRLSSISCSSATVRKSTGALVTRPRSVLTEMRGRVRQSATYRLFLRATAPAKM
jgi:uncharacterized protein (TIGR00725 family)